MCLSVIRHVNRYTLIHKHVVSSGDTVDPVTCTDTNLLRLFGENVINRAVSYIKVYILILRHNEVLYIGFGVICTWNLYNVTSHLRFWCRIVELSGFYRYSPCSIFLCARRVRLVKVRPPRHEKVNRIKTRVVTRDGICEPRAVVASRVPPSPQTPCKCYYSVLEIHFMDSKYRGRMSEVVCSCFNLTVCSCFNFDLCSIY